MPLSMHDLRLLDRRAALGRCHVAALEFPRREAAMVHMATTDQRTHVRRTASSKFKLERHLAAPHWIATYRTRRARAMAAERAGRFVRWQSAATDRFAGFLSEDRLVGHGSPPRMAVPVHAQRVLQTKGNPNGTRAETQWQGSHPLHGLEKYLMLRRANLGLRRSI